MEMRRSSNGIMVLLTKCQTKANHFALAKCLETDLASEAESSPTLPQDDLNIGQAVIDFNNDWNDNANAFEKWFETARYGKKDWISRKIEAG
ncbi:hypothetical protein VNO77_36968 [Canavalia gladiata]|uniref:XS domain-containing protein n=1 Tax=Canavalia gladiata TaxID=3824 RepID=A0AAN9PVW6_CANGL